MPFPIRLPRRPAGGAVVAAAVAAIVALPLLTGSAALAQTTGALSASSPTSPPPPEDGLNVTDLLAQLRSPDVTLRQRATVQFLERHGTPGRELLEAAKRQVLEVKQLRASREADQKAAIPAAKQTSAEKQAEEKRFWEGNALLQEKSGVAAQTIQFLGDLRVEEAIPFLIENSRFIDHRVPFKFPFFPYYFPCLGALALIGMPAADVLLRTIEETPDHTTRWNATALAWAVGPRAASGLIQDRIAALRFEQRRLWLKPSLPVSVRIARLEAVRAVLEARGRELGDRASFLEEHAAFLKGAQ